MHMFIFLSMVTFVLPSANSQERNCFVTSSPWTNDYMSIYICICAYILTGSGTPLPPLPATRNNRFV